MDASKRQALLWTALYGVAILAVFPQELRHTTGVVNIEVPVRVFDADRFVDDLTIGDFEVLENGKPQKILSLYLVRKTKVEKRGQPGGTGTHASRSGQGRSGDRPEFRADLRGP